jgi:hypothetical protein
LGDRGFRRNESSADQQLDAGPGSSGRTDPAGVTREELDELFATHIDYLIEGIRRDRA